VVGRLGSNGSRITHMFAILFICLAVTVVGWNPVRLQQITRPVLTVLLIGSLIFGLYAPDLAITPPTPPDVTGYWHGLTSQKNQLGSLASIGTLLWIHGWAAAGRIHSGAGGRRYSRLPAAALAQLDRAHGHRAVRRADIDDVALATVLSATLLAVPDRLVCSRDACLFARRVESHPRLGNLLKPIAIITGKDTTFTARTQIWEIIRAHIQFSPFVAQATGLLDAPVPPRLRSPSSRS